MRARQLQWAGPSAKTSLLQSRRICAARRTCTPALRRARRSCAIARRICACSCISCRVVAQFRLNLVGRLLDHLPYQVRFGPVRGLEFEPHGFRCRLEQGQQELAGNFRTCPNQQRKLNIVLRSRDQGGVAELREARRLMRMAPSTTERCLIVARQILVTFTI
jgi:hypothetical protein